jgi:hypothetical protein
MKTKRSALARKGENVRRNSWDHAAESRNGLAQPERAAGKKKDTNTDTRPIGGQTIEDPSGAKKSVHKKREQQHKGP